MKCRKTLAHDCVENEKQVRLPEGPLNDFHIKSSFSSFLNPAALNILQTAG